MEEKNNSRNLYYEKKYLSQDFFGIHFIFYAGSGWDRNVEKADLPKWSKAKPYLEEAMHLVLDNKREVSFSGLPECMLLDFRGLVVDSWRPFDEEIVMSRLKVINISRNRSLKEKIKPKICSSCFWNNSCEGIWKFYFRKYGFEELMPQKHPF